MKTQDPARFAPTSASAQPSNDAVFLRFPSKVITKPIVIERTQMTPRFHVETPNKYTKTTNATLADTDRSKEFDSHVKELSGMFQNVRLSPQAKQAIQESLTSSIIKDPLLFCKKQTSKPTSSRHLAGTSPHGAVQGQSLQKSKIIDKTDLRSSFKPTKGVLLEPKLMSKFLKRAVHRKPVQTTLTFRPSSSSKIIQKGTSSERKLPKAPSSSSFSLKKQNSNKSLRSSSEKKLPPKKISFTPSPLYALSRQSIQDKLVTKFRKPAQPKAIVQKDFKSHPATKDPNRADEDDDDAFIERVYNRLMKLNFQLSSALTTS